MHCNIIDWMRTGSNSGNERYGGKFYVAYGSLFVFKFYFSNTVYVERGMGSLEPM